MRKQEVIILVIILIISTTLLSSLFFYKRNLKHKNEINMLLNAEDIIKSNNNPKYSLINEYKKDENGKENSKDFITDIENGEGFTTDIENKQHDADTQEGVHNVNSEDVIFLAKLINSEAGDEPYEGKIAVANVVLYRAKEDKKSIQDVIYASGQFDGVQTRLFLDNPDSESLSAARQALKGKKVLDKAYYFANLKLCDPSWATEENFLCRIGDHWFFKE